MSTHKTVFGSKAEVGADMYVEEEPTCDVGVYRQHKLGTVPDQQLQDALSSPRTLCIL